MNTYVNTIIVAGDGHTNPSYLKLGNRSELEKNQISFVLPNGTTIYENKNNVVFRHESGKTATVEAVFADPSVVSCIVPASVQAIPGYYTVHLDLRTAENESVFMSNEIKCFIQGDNFGITSAIASGLMSTVQSPTMPYITMKGGELYTSTDGEEWHPVIEPYIITDINNAGDSTVYEYGKIIIVDMLDGSFNLKIGDGVTSFENLPWVNIIDVESDNPDELFFRAAGRWVTAEKIVEISDDGYWILAGVKTDTPVVSPTFEIGEVTDGDVGEVTLTGTPTNNVLNFVVPRGKSSDIKVGNLEELNTVNKSNIVNAVNEVLASIPKTMDWDSIQHKPGIDGDIDIVVSNTQPSYVAGRTIIWIEIE